MQNETSLEYIFGKDEILGKTLIQRPKLLQFSHFLS